MQAEREAKNLLLAGQLGNLNDMIGSLEDLTDRLVGTVPVAGIGKPPSEVGMVRPTPTLAETLNSAPGMIVDFRDRLNVVKGRLTEGLL